MNYNTGINWNLFFDQVDLIHDDKPVYIPNFLSNYSKYLSWEDVESYVNYSKQEIVFLDKTTKTNWISPPTDLTLYNQQLQNKEFIIDHINEGYTFLYSNHSKHNTLANALCYEVDKIFKTISDIQIFGSTSNNSVSFPPHVDSNPIFAFQTYGSVDWIIYDNPVTHIYPKGYIENNINSNKLNNPVTYTLNPGDFLYIPERTIHKVLLQNPRLTMSLQLFPSDTLKLTVNRNLYKIKI